MPWFVAQLPLDLVPSRPVLMLGLAALAFYIAARLGAAALDRGGLNTAAAAAAHWLPIAAVVLVVLKQQPLTSISMIFATTVACLSLVPGVTLFSAPTVSDDGSSLHAEMLLEQPDRKAWAMVLPAALLALLAGFSGQFKLWHAAVFVVQGLLGLLLWTAPPAQASSDIASSVARSISSKPPRATSILVLQILFWIGLTLAGAVVATVSIRDIPDRVPRLTGGTVAALMVAPALVLPLIGSSLGYARDGRTGAVVSTCVGVALLNLCVLLPLTIITWHFVSSASAGQATAGDFFRGDWLAAPAQALAYPMLVWRLDTVIVIVIGAALVPISAGRWVPRRLEGAAAILIYGFYMVFSARHAIR